MDSFVDHHHRHHRPIVGIVPGRSSMANYLDRKQSRSQRSGADRLEPLSRIPDHDTQLVDAIRCVDLRCIRKANQGIQAIRSPQDRLGTPRVISIQLAWSCRLGFHRSLARRIKPGLVALVCRLSFQADSPERHTSPMAQSPSDQAASAHCRLSSSVFSV
jgi:hypothetical protein